MELVMFVIYFHEYWSHFMLYYKHTLELTLLLLLMSRYKFGVSDGFIFVNNFLHCLKLHNN
jgi:hypothetical protein